MKFAILFSLFLIASSVIDPVHGSESALDCQTAIDTLAAGIEVHPAQAVVLFQDALQTNPDCRSQLLMKAIQLTGGETTILARLIYAARIEFPEDDNLFAEAAMTVAPDCGAEIREAFMKSPVEMGEGLAIGSAELMADGEKQGGQRTMDEDIREAIARMTAKAEGKHWPEQELSDEPLQFRKPDEIRVSNESGVAEEASLANGLALDKVDERALSHLPVKIDDARKPSIAIRLDESKFAAGMRTDSTEPLEAELRSIAPAGEAQVTESPVPKQSSAHRVAPSTELYHSTIDVETGDTPRPLLIIRPPSTAQTAPE